MTINKNKIIAAAQKYQQKGQLDKAIKELQLLVDDDPKDVRTLLKIGDLQSKKGDRQGATATYMRVAEFYSQQGFFLKAVAVYKQILRVDQGIVEVNLKLAELYHQLGLISDAMTQYQQVVAAHERQGQTTESLMVLRKMVELDPDNIASRIKLAELCSAQGLVADAVREFESAADYLKQQQRQDDWIKVAERLVFHDPARLDVLKELSRHYLQRNDTKRALAKLQICFKAAPRDLEVLELLARAFAALGQAPKAVSVYKEIAKIHDDEGRADQAAQVWETIAQLAPDDPDLRARLHPSQPGGFEPVAPLSFPSFPPTSAGLQPVSVPSPVAPVPVPREPVLAPPRPTVVVDVEAPPAASVEQTAKLLSETDVYIKYGLKDRALEHLRKIFDIDPDYEAAYVKQKSIALAMGDRALAARAVENLVRITLRRGDVDAAAGHVAELEGFLPGYAGLPALRAALDGGPLPAGPASAADEFDEVSVDIAVATDEEIEELGPEAIEAEEDVREHAADVLDLSAADAIDEEPTSAMMAAASAADAYAMEELEAAAEQLGDDEALLLEASADAVEDAAADLMDQAVQSVVLHDEVPRDLDEPEIPDDLVLGASSEAPAAELLQELEDGVDDFEEVLPTSMMTAAEMEAMRASYGVQRAAPGPVPPPEPELLDDDVAGVADDLVLEPPAGEPEALGGEADDLLDDRTAAPLDLDQAVLAASGLMDDDGAASAFVDTDDALLGGDALEAAALESVDEVGDPAAAGLLGVDEELEAADALPEPAALDDRAAEFAALPDDDALALQEDAVATRATDELAPASALAAAPLVTEELDAPPAGPAPVFEALDDDASRLEPAVASDAADLAVAGTGAADAILGAEEAPAQVPPAAIEDEAFVPTAQFAAAGNRLHELPLADDDEGAFRPVSGQAEARLQRAIERAADPFARDVEADAGGIGTSTEIMGLSDSELAEIRAFATGAPQRLPPPPPPRPRTPAPPVEAPPPLAPPAAAASGFDDVAVTDPAATASLRPAAGDEEPDPAEEFFGDELGEADFFVRQGLLDEARDILHSILEDVPDSRKAQALLKQIEHLESGGNGEAEAASSEGAFDLASELLSELEDLGAPEAPPEDFQYSVDEVFSEFKRGVEKAVSADDADTHYDLGIAYKEMGLVEDAIHEFEISTQAVTKRADALYMMGLCEVELGRHQDAVRRFKDAIHVENITPAQKLAVMFELGVAHQALDQTQEALHILDKVFKKNPKFKDVAARVQALGGGDAGDAAAPRPSVKKGKNISYL